MTSPEPAPSLVAGHAVWLAGDETTGAAFVGRGPETDRHRILAHILGRPLPVAWLRQVHGNGLRRVEAGGAGCAGEADAVATSASAIGLAVSTADCVPLILGSSERVVAVHAGWRGIASRIVHRAVTELGDPETAAAWIGPAIGPCCYEVGHDVAEAVTDAAGASALARSPGRRPHLDLVAAVSAQLRNAGVRRVAAIHACTRCRAELHSHRRDGQEAGRNLAFGWRREAV
jgi:YfiH family protein